MLLCQYIGLRVLEYCRPTDSGGIFLMLNVPKLASIVITKIIYRITKFIKSRSCTRSRYKYASECACV